MKIRLYIFVSFLIGLVNAQNDSINTFILGCTVSEINFIDYSIVKDNTLDKLGYYQGFNFNLFLRSQNNFQFELGVLGGNSYPLFKNLNYYFGVSYPIFTKNKKNYFEINPKIMYSRSSIPDISGKTVFQSFSFLLGLSYFRKVKRFELGIGYYFWGKDDFIDYRYANNHTNKQGLNVVSLYEKQSNNIGIIMITSRFLIKK